MNKSSSSLKPSRAIFLKAAQDVFKVYQGVVPDCEESRYCCDNLNRLRQKLQFKKGSVSLWDEGPEYTLFYDLFYPGEEELECSFAWWPLLTDLSWDYESRILALLLCAEMLRKPSAKCRAKKTR